MKCATWNLEWAPIASKRTSLIQSIITSLQVDVFCYTEAIRDMVPERYRIEAAADYGYSHSGERRKVILWSKSPWTEIDQVGSEILPSGRFISGISNGIRFVGVCIPWKDAHVTTGRKDRTPWQDHLAYCAGLKEVINRYSESDIPICVLGDYNQRIPRIKQPPEIFQALREAIPPHCHVVTEGILDHEQKPLIDHVVTSSGISATIEQIIPRHASDGTRLTDHSGVVCHIGIMQ